MMNRTELNPRTFAITAGLALTGALIATPLNGFAATSLVRAASLGPEGFAAAAARNPELLPLLETQEAESPTDTQAKRLAAGFSRAQALFLDGSLDEATRAFRDVVRMAQEADWRETHRRAISFSFMRLAQLASSPAAVEEKVESAAAFAPDLRPDASAFPPPLIQEWDRAASRLRARSTAIRLADKFPGYDLVKIDGRSFSLRSAVLVPISSGPHRVSALSNSHPYFSQVLTAAQLEEMRVDRQPLAAGDCDRPEVAQEIERAPVSAYAVAYEDCVKTRGASGWADATNGLPAKSRLDLAPRMVSGGPGAPEWTRIDGLSRAAPEVRTGSSRKWYWVAAAAVVVGASYAFVSAQRNSRGGSGPPSEAIAPTHTSGL